MPKEIVSVLAIGDVHIQTSNTKIIKSMLKKLIEIINLKNPDFIVLLGDILHTHEMIHTEALNLAIHVIRTLSQIGPPLIVLIGNHDLINNQQFLSEKHAFNALKKWENVTIVDKIYHLEIKNHLFTFSPYVPNGRFEEALNTGGGKWRNSTAIFGHQEFKGCKMGSIISSEGDDWDERNPLVIMGHIHDKQRPQKNIIYTGTPIQHGYGDSSKKTIGFFTFIKKKNSEKYKYEEIDLGLPKKVTIRITLPDFDIKKIIKKINRGEKRGDELKISISGTAEQFKSFRKSGEFKQLSESKAKLHLRTLKQKKPNLPKELDEEIREFIILEDDDSEDTGDNKKIMENKVRKKNKDISFEKLLKLLVKKENKYTRRALKYILKKVSEKI